MSKDNNYIYNKNNHDYAEALKVIFDIKLEAFILQQKEIIKENTKIHLEELKKRNIYFILRKIQAEEDKLVEEIEEYVKLRRYLIISKAKINSVIIIILICIIAIANILQ